MASAAVGLGQGYGYDCCCGMQGKKNGQRRDVDWYRGDASYLRVVQGVWGLFCVSPMLSLVLQVWKRTPPISDESCMLELLKRPPWFQDWASWSGPRAGVVGVEDGKQS